MNNVKLNRKELRTLNDYATDFLKNFDWCIVVADVKFWSAGEYGWVFCTDKNWGDLKMTDYNKLTKSQLIEKIKIINADSERYAGALTLILESGQLKQEMEIIAMVGLGYVSEQSWYDAIEAINNKIENN